MSAPRPIAVRFAEQHMPEPNSGCWLWTGYCDPQGYGRLNISKVPVLAHRISWEMYRGPIPEGMCICHKCDTPACVNPNHFFLGTRADNLADMTEKGRRASHNRTDYFPRGEAHGCAKLTVERVLAIRSDPRKQRDIAAAYGISQVTVGQIKRHETWRHI